MKGAGRWLFYLESGGRDRGGYAGGCGWTGVRRSGNERGDLCERVLLGTREMAVKDYGNLRGRR